MAAVWRLLEHGPVDGALNMALDRAVQLAREEGSAPPTLRLYSWARPTITLGRFQKAIDVNAEVVAREGIDVVRRFTGGRGVLHDDELTYAVVASVDDGVPRGVAASYRHLCEALVAAYQELGLGDAELTRRDTGDASSGACYLQTTRADLSLGATKLSGSAQVWHQSTVMQHGSFTVTRDVDREARVFSLTAEQAVHLAQGTATIAGPHRPRPTTDALRRAVINGFERALGVSLVEGTLTAREAELAAELVSLVRVTQEPSHRG